jgi:hypothetical protein
VAGREQTNPESVVASACAPVLSGPCMIVTGASPLLEDKAASYA